MQHEGDGGQQRGMQRRDEGGGMEPSRGQIQYHGDRAWHRGTDAWGNPVWYRAFGWSYTSGEQEGRQSDQEPREYGRTRSRHYDRSNERIRDDVYDRLNDHPNIDSSEIEVRVEQGVVTLEGTVHDRRQKRLAEDITESVSGVHDVQNHLRVPQSQGQQSQGISGQGEMHDGQGQGFQHGEPAQSGANGR